jgi:hypothetical protein
MKEISKQNFGLLIAYLLPGLVVLWGVSYFSETVRVWLMTGEQSSSAVAGFLYVTLGAFTAGLTLSALRAVTVDALHHCTGIAKPEWDFSEFQGKFWAYNQLVESHYCFYQFYAHMCLAVPALIAAHRIASDTATPWWVFVGCLILELVLFVVSRQTLKTYYTRASDLLGIEGGGAMAENVKPAVRQARIRRGRQSLEGVLSPSLVAEAAPATKHEASTRARRW